MHFPCDALQLCCGKQVAAGLAVLESESCEVLLIEDDPAAAVLISRWLKGTGAFQVTWAATGTEGSDWIRAKRWELIICDLELPGVNGLRLLDQARSAQPRTPVLLVTGFPSVSAACSALRLKAADFLVKPLNRAAFLDRALALATAGASDHPTGELQQRSQEHAQLISLVLGGVTHRLRNKLTPVLGFTDLLVTRFARELSAEGRSYCDSITHSAGQATETLEEIQRLVLDESGPTSVVDLNAAVDDALALLRPGLPRLNFTLSYSPPKRGFLVTANPLQVQRAILYLFSALAHLFSGSAPRQIEIRLTPVGGYVRFEVSTEMHLPAAQRAKLQPLALLDDTDIPAEGVRVSLRACRRIATTYGGELIVHSDGRGTRLAVAFPRASTPEQSESKLRALVVGRTVSSLSVVSDVLAELGFLVINSDAAASALKLIGDHSFDLLIVDLDAEPDPVARLLRNVHDSHPALEGATVLLTNRLDHSPSSKMSLVFKPVTRPALIDACTRLSSRKPLAGSSSLATAPHFTA